VRRKSFKKNEDEKKWKLEVSEKEVLNREYLLSALIALFLIQLLTHQTQLT
jgi:hypothetical protein